MAAAVIDRKGRVHFVNVRVVAPPPLKSDCGETGKLMGGCSPTACCASSLGDADSRSMVIEILEDGALVACVKNGVMIGDPQKIREAAALMSKNQDPK